MTNKKIFISSPYTLGDTAANVRKQHEAFAALIKLGHVPFAPLFSHYHELIYPTDYEVWLKWDFEWLTQCDYVLRLPGESKGADAECAEAQKHNIPVLDSWELANQALLPPVPCEVELWEAGNALRELIDIEQENPFTQQRVYGAANLMGLE